MEHEKEPAPDSRAGVRHGPAAWLISAALFAGLTVAGFAMIAMLFGGTLPRFDARLVAPRAVALILIFLAVYFASDGLRLYFVLRTIGVRVPLRELLPLIFINILFSNVTPLATGGGFAQVWYLQRRGVPVGASAAATTIRTILAMLVIFIAALLFQLLLPQVAPQGFARAALHSVSGFIVVYIVGFLIVLRRPLWIAALLGWLLALASRVRILSADRRDRWTAAVRRESAEFAAGFARFVGGSRRHAALSVLATLVFLLTLFAFPALLLQLLDYDVDWPRVIGTLSLVTFLMYFAPTPGGAGFAELAFAGLMAGQMRAGDLLLVVVAWRFLTIYLGMAIGAVVSAAVLSLRRRAG